MLGNCGGARETFSSLGNIFLVKDRDLLGKKILPVLDNNIATTLGYGYVEVFFIDISILVLI